MGDPTGQFLFLLPAASPAVAALGQAAIALTGGLALAVGIDAAINANNNAGDALPPIPDAKGGEKSNTGTRQWEKPGDFGDANNDFDNLRPTGVQDKGEGVRVGKLPNGDRVIVRPTSSDGQPTIEIQRPDGKRSKHKTRYCQ
ncbi:MAG: hypothetical protein WAW42_01580 [Candidatus Competibacteraceae bacterium]